MQGEIAHTASLFLSHEENYYCMSLEDRLDLVRQRWYIVVVKTEGFCFAYLLHSLRLYKRSSYIIRRGRQVECKIVRIIGVIFFWKESFILIEIKKMSNSMELRINQFNWFNKYVFDKKKRENLQVDIKFAGQLKNVFRFQA